MKQVQVRLTDPHNDADVVLLVQDMFPPKHHGEHPEMKKIRKKRISDVLIQSTQQHDTCKYYSSASSIVLRT